MSARHHWHNTGELHTLRDWLRYAVSAFNEAQLTFGHGSANAYDEAAWGAQSDALSILSGGTLSAAHCVGYGSPLPCVPVPCCPAQGGQ